MVTGQALSNMSASNLANIYQDHSTHLGYPMKKFICIDDDDCMTCGSSVEDAFDNYKSDISDYVDIEELTFYELKNPIKASLKLVLNGVE